jgi:hypothetical protein
LSDKVFPLVARDGVGEGGGKKMKRIFGLLGALAAVFLAAGAGFKW